MVLLRVHEFSKAAASRKCSDKRGAFAMRLKYPQRRSVSPQQVQHLDSCSVENIADSIVLLRNENDRLRKIAESLSVETQNIERSMSPTKSASWWHSPRLKALL